MAEQQTQTSEEANPQDKWIDPSIVQDSFTSRLLAPMVGAAYNTAFAIPNMIDRLAVEPVKEAYNYFSNVAEGKENPLDPDNTAQNFNMAGLVAAGGSVVPKPVNSLGMFGGGRMKNSVAQEALAMAKDLKAKGQSEGAIREATNDFIANSPQKDVLGGVHLGDDGQWRVEISDANAKFQSGIADIFHKDAPFDKGVNTNMGRVLDHPALFEAYPGLQDVKVSLVKGKNTSGTYFNNARNIEVRADSPEKAREVLLHEVQHWVQAHEGFEPGASPNDLAMQVVSNDIYHSVSELDKKVLNARNALDQFYADNPNARQEVTSLAKQYEWAASDQIEAAERDIAKTNTEHGKLLKALKDARAASTNERSIGSTSGPSFDYEYLAYRRMAGEVEARNAPFRSEMPSDELRDIHPNQTSDVAKDKRYLYNDFFEDRVQHGKSRSIEDNVSNDNIPHNPGVPNPRKGLLSSIEGGLPKEYGKFVDITEPKDLKIVSSNYGVDTKGIEKKDPTFVKRLVAPLDRMADVLKQKDLSGPERALYQESFNMLREAVQDSIKLKLRELKANKR